MLAVIDKGGGKVSDTVGAASDRLLKAIKTKLLRKGKIDYSVLRKQGYSEATIARLKEL